MILGATVGLLAAGTLAHGTFHRNSPVFGRALGRLPAPAGDHVVALTFDDGPNPEATPRILDALASSGTTATFFLLGRHVERWPDLARRVADEGHAIGNHGWHHRKLHRLSPSRVREDLELGTKAIVDATGVSPRLFRAPHGFRAPWVTPIAASLGQRTIGWSLGVWDSDRPGVDAIVDRTVGGTRPGSIVLLHDGDGYAPTGDRTQTAAAVPLIVASLDAGGYHFVPVPTA
ncbi:MAG: polysaccharide deacetylase family protein [Gemmatimonadaceae bacterium]|nr:polysaccharide deacetylase family protein [Gemmatimonadaceae bacterium]NUQ92063.1 polysaccharide deacetylase family protein [Gemmatimonadaceae bacterium]NUR34949.1 polysaccharide deacetylase family protein [Gemmatimonadaceae bacterium]NUS97936.1 polysaccharide deacetylase family protein [Gemmatimonadaceae bacterium]